MIVPIRNQDIVIMVKIGMSKRSASLVKNLNECCDSRNGSCSLPIIVFVHLGSNPAITLNWFAQQAERNVERKHLCLITDHPDRFKEFPGQILIYDRTKINSGFKKFSRTNSTFKKISGGYWRYTTERLFALSVLSKHFSESHPVVHLESDVLLIAKNKQLETVINTIRKTRVVRNSDSDGIESILIAPSIRDLNEKLNNLGKILLDNPHVFSDMELLGLALNQGILGELPNSPEEAWIVDFGKKHSVFFDGAFYGQYLFGLDPIHTNNKIVNGYSNPKSVYNLSGSQWELQNPDEYDGLCLSLQNSDGPSFPLCLHLHSKTMVNKPSNTDLFWLNLVSAVNIGSFTELNSNQGESIHSEKLKFRQRLSIFMYKKIRSLRSRI